MERMALKATTANASRIHDRGGTVEPVIFEQRRHWLACLSGLCKSDLCLVTAPERPIVVSFNPILRLLHKAAPSCQLHSDSSCQAKLPCCSHAPDSTPSLSYPLVCSPDCASPCLQTEDISVHYRPYREHSLHGGNAFYQGALRRSCASQHLAVPSAASPLCGRADLLSPAGIKASRSSVSYGI